MSSRLWGKIQNSRVQSLKPNPTSHSCEGEMHTFSALRPGSAGLTRTNSRKDDCVPTPAKPHRILRRESEILGKRVSQEYSKIIPQDDSPEWQVGSLESQSQLLTIFTLRSRVCDLGDWCNDLFLLVIKLRRWADFISYSAFCCIVLLYGPRHTVRCKADRTFCVCRKKKCCNYIYN